MVSFYKLVLIRRLNVCAMHIKQEKVAVDNALSHEAACGIISGKVTGVQTPLVFKHTFILQELEQLSYLVQNELRLSDFSVKFRNVFGEMLPDSHC